MGYITSEILQQYLHCPRYFFLNKIRGIRLSTDSRWEVIENIRSDIKNITFRYFSYISTSLNIPLGEKIINLKRLGKLLPLDYSCIKNTPNHHFLEYDLELKVYAILNFVLLSISQESYNKEEKTRFPISITFFPQSKDPQELIKENPAALVEYSDSKIVVLSQKFSQPQNRKEKKNQISLTNLFLIQLYQPNLTRIVTIDYRTMKISFDSIRKFDSRRSKSNLNIILDKFYSLKYDPLMSSSCNICEFKLICEVSEKVIPHG
ncbi:MAG: hypothetical protein ACW98F_05360 [Candidatus Hodarchaeales archaeon]|jgi:hypothetical protein